MRTSCLLLSQTPQRSAKLKNNAIPIHSIIALESIVIFALKLLFMLACDSLILLQVTNISCFKIMFETLNIFSICFNMININISYNPHKQSSLVASVIFKSVKGS